MVRTKIWLGVGAFAMVQAGCGTDPVEHGLAFVPMAFAQESGEAGEAAAAGEAGEAGASTEAGEGGEGEGGEGGEGGGGVPSSYALGSTDPNAFNYDAAPQIAAYAALVRASYEKAEADAEVLKDAVEALLADPTDDTLAAARFAWINARIPYLQTEAFRFYDGPIEAVEGQINAWPLNEAFIDAVAGDPDAGIVNDPSVPLDRDTLLGRNQATDEADVTTGWHAIEFLLWGQDADAYGPGDRPAADFIAGEPDNDRRREYLQLTTALLVDDLEGLVEAWDLGNPDSPGSKFVALPPREALGRIVNGIAILAGFEMMSERLAVALDSGDQEDEHSCFSDTTRNDFLYDVRGIRNVYFGDFGATQGPGLNELVAVLDPALAQRMIDLLDRAEAAVTDLDQPFDRVLAAPPDSRPRAEAEAAVMALQDLADGLHEVGRVLGVLVLIPS